MANTILVGAQWGDEGKGKIIDVLTEQADIVVRTQGGNNAGHTVYLGKQKYVLHLVPSGICAGASCVIGNGVVVGPSAWSGNRRPAETGRGGQPFPERTRRTSFSLPPGRRSASSRADKIEPPNGASGRLTATRRRASACGD
jgi:hypothetical protein